MKLHSLGVLSFALLIGVGSTADPFGRCRESNYNEAGDCPYEYNCVRINPGKTVYLIVFIYALLT